MGYRIKQVREAKGITQEKLAELSGVSRGTIVALESGEAKITTTKTLVKLADALNTTVEEIFFSGSV